MLSGLVKSTDHPSSKLIFGIPCPNGPSTSIGGESLSRASYSVFEALDFPIQNMFRCGIIQVGTS